MRISIFGMGYVGVVSAGCLLRDGHAVTGVDPVESKVRDLMSGRTPIQEPGLAQLLAAGHKAGRLSATTSPEDGINGADMVWVCVGTPSSLEQGIDLSHVEAVMRQIGRVIAEQSTRPLVVLRSTVLPGTMDRVVVPTLEKSSGLQIGHDFDVVFHPEFLREGSAVADFDTPPKIVIGEGLRGAGQRLMRLYDNYHAPKFQVPFGEAEMVKYCDNLFHALKVTFANEVGAIARSVGVDARRVADVFCADTKLNISSKYLRPGFAFGGSCLPKDLRAILRHASLQSISVPLLRATLESNNAQIESLVRRILELQPKKVGMIGLAFKPDTDDMRESPYVTVAKRLAGEGMMLSIYDENTQPEQLIGSNKVAVENALGHLQDFLVGSPERLAGCDLIIINHARVDADCVMNWLNTGTRVVDLASVAGIDRNTPGYEGIAW